MTRTLRWWLAMLAVAAALPVLLLVTWLFVTQLRNEQREARDRALRIAQGIAERIGALHTDSTVLLQHRGINVLTDPILSQRASPLSFAGPRRHSPAALAATELPPIDVVVISHDHYDHLDVSTIRTLGDGPRYFVPLGLKTWLINRGINAERITELDWWEGATLDHLSFTATPARHFSGRGITDSKKTLWASWVLAGKNTNIYFSGDSGYGPHFAEIKEKFGPFDFAMMECGQYNEKWEAIHMMPEQTARAAVDVGAKVMMPIHWGAFVLALHSWTDPIERVTRKAGELKIPIATPKIGQPVILNRSRRARWSPGRPSTTRGSGTTVSCSG